MVMALSEKSKQKAVGYVVWSSDWSARGMTDATVDLAQDHT